MNIKAFFPCGGGSNLILGTGKENQIFFLRTPTTVNFFLPNCQKITWGCHGGCLMPPDTPMLFLFLEKQLYAFDWKDNFCSQEKITWGPSDAPQS